jgi:Protein of unknown function (DUF3987)
MEDSDLASEESYDDAIRAAQDRLHAANQPDGDPKDRPRACEEIQRAKRAKEDARKQAEQTARMGKPFPVAALGPTLERAVWAIEQRTMAPTELCVSSILAAVALAAQSVGSVVLRSGAIVPLSLFLLAIAESTERKSSVDGIAMAPVKDYERELAEVYATQKPQYDIENAAWIAQHNKILSDKKLDRATQEAQLKELGAKPMAPKRPRLTVSTATPEALVKMFEIARPALGVYSAEGAQFLGGYAFSKEKKNETLGIVNALWSGEIYSKVTIVHGEQTLSNKRLAMHLMLQPHIAKVVLNDDDLAVSGFMGRALICRPRSRIGTRIWTEKPGHDVSRALGKYALCLQALFQAAETTDTGELKLRTLTLSGPAEEVAVAFYNEIERAQAQGGKYEKIKPQAGRAEEHARRIAGTLELFYFQSAKIIGELSMQRGIAIMRWYLDEALRVIEGETLADEVTDAGDILAWARGGSKSVKRNAHGGLTFSLRDLTKDGPNRLRPRGDNAERIRLRCRAALNYAIDTGRLFVDGSCADAWYKSAKTGRFTFNLFPIN